MVMFTNNEQKKLNINNANLTTITEQEFFKKVFSINNNQIQQDAKMILSIIEELIRDRIGNSLEVTYGIVKNYDEYNKKANVELVTSVDYDINVLNNIQDISMTEIKKEQTIDNISIFHPLKQGDNVIVIVPQGKISSNSFIIGVLQQYGHKSLFDYYLEQKNEIMSLKSEINILRNMINELNSKINSITTSTT